MVIIGIQELNQKKVCVALLTLMFFKNSLLFHQFLAKGQKGTDLFIEK
jgi:hypothetical protein